MKKRQIVTGLIIFFSVLPQFSSLACGSTLQLNTLANLQFGEMIKSSNATEPLPPTFITTGFVKEYWAVLIGLNDYPGDVNDLPWSVNEITCFKNTLLSSGNWQEDHIKMLINSDATKQNIANATMWLDQHEDYNDVSIFYYAGHGSTGVEHQYINVYDGKISDEELATTFDTIEGRLIVIVDSCFSGGFIEELKGRKRVVLTACEEDQSTYQDSNLRSGFFGYFFNLTLNSKTKTAEMTFLFAYPLIVSYSKKVSEEYGEDFLVNPQMYDGSIFLTKVLRNYLRVLLPIIAQEISDFNFNSSRKVWRM